MDSNHLLSREEALKLKLTGSYVLVERFNPPDRLTPGSLIVLPIDYMSVRGTGISSTHDNPRMRVVSVGPGELLEDGTREEMPNIGDIVLCDSLVSDPRALVSKEVEGQFEGLFIAHVVQFEGSVTE